MSIEHYENFPVASWLCPPALRPAVRAIYAYARTADDLADEGDAPAPQRLADLADYADHLEAVYDGSPVEPSRWPQVFGALSPVIARHGLPEALLLDLISAFEQDVTQDRYADRRELLEYCRRSANPIGRLMLHLVGVNDGRSLAQSDAICTALQLINFWQDLSVDTARGRLYVPLDHAERMGVAASELLSRADGPRVRRLVAELVDWSRGLMNFGAPLALRLPGRFGWELRLVVQGGLRVLDHLAHHDFDALVRRPVLRRRDVPVLLWRAATMGRATPDASSTLP